MELEICDVRCALQYQVDAFTEKSFGGNPAAIVLRHGDDEWMQKLAEENNLSETAYLRQRLEENSKDTVSYDIRWYILILLIKSHSFTSHEASSLVDTAGLPPPQKSTFVDMPH